MIDAFDQEVLLVWHAHMLNPGIFLEVRANRGYHEPWSVCSEK